MPASEESQGLVRRHLTPARIYLEPSEPPTHSTGPAPVPEPHSAPQSSGSGRGGEPEGRERSWGWDGAGDGAGAGPASSSCPVLSPLSWQLHRDPGAGSLPISWPCTHRLAPSPSLPPRSGQPCSPQRAVVLFPSRSHRALSAWGEEGAGSWERREQRAPLMPATAPRVSASRGGTQAGSITPRPHSTAPGGNDPKQGVLGAISEKSRV